MGTATVEVTTAVAVVVERGDVAATATVVAEGLAKVVEVVTETGGSVKAMAETEEAVKGKG